MPHGGYHGNVVIGGNVVQSGNPDGSISGGIDNRSRLDFNPPQSNQNNQNINQQIADKKKEIEAINDLQEGTFEPMFIDGQMFAATTAGTQGVDAKGLATLQNFQNQQLNNLLRQQQEINLANQIKDSFATFGSDKQTADNLRKLFTGDLGDKTFLGINFGSTETTDPDKTSGLGAATVINPYTGERITTGKIREGMTSPEYAQYMSDLYDLNPALMEQIFPFASGQVAKPIIARIGEGIMGIPGASELAQMGGDVVGAMISPLSGLFTGETAKTGFVNPKAPTGGSGIVEAVPEGMDMSIYGSFIGKPGPFTADFIDQDGDGVDDRFQSGPGKPKAPPYSPPKQPAETIIPSQKLTPFDIKQFYSSLPQYTQQGIMNPNLMQYYKNLGLFPGMAI